MEAFPKFQTLSTPNINPQNFSLLTLTLDAGDLWAGGMETVVSTTAWGLLHLIHQPDIQRRLHAEFVDTLGERPYELGDKAALPYFHAFIDELQRWANVLPWHLPHALSGEVTMNGKRIPSGTLVMCQFGALFMDHERFPEPECFDPSRFIRYDAVGSVSH